MGSSRGSLTALHQEFIERNSVVFSVRIRIEDLASIGEFLVKSGFPPKSGGHALSQAFTMFSEALISHRQARKYELNEAKVLCEQLGLNTGTRRNVRIFGCQVEPKSRSNVLSPEELKKALELLKQYQAPIVDQAECTIPKSDDDLLSEMEKGVPNVASSE
jgi:hypothetical protein